MLNLEELKLPGSYAMSKVMFGSMGLIYWCCQRLHSVSSVGRRQELVKC